MNDGSLKCQVKFFCPIGPNQIVGFMDRTDGTHLWETKLSLRPEFYTQKENIDLQIGTYLLGVESLQCAIVEPTRVPAFRTGQGKYSDESMEQFEERIYSDIVSRPAHYFLGWDRKTRTFGVKFWRSEFDLEEIFQTYVHVLREIREVAKTGAWYRNNLACHVPTPCVYLPIKRTGVVSEEIFEKRQVKGGE